MKTKNSESLIFLDTHTIFLKDKGSALIQCNVLNFIYQSQQGFFFFFFLLPSIIFSREMKVSKSGSILEQPGNPERHTFSPRHWNRSEMWPKKLNWKPPHGSHILHWDGETGTDMKLYICKLQLSNSEK